MAFSFSIFIEELRENDEKKEIIEKYEKHYGPITGDIKDQYWYVNYVSTFSPVEYKTPPEIRDDEYDWLLLEQFIAASFSSEWSFEINDNDETEFVVSVASGDKTVVKKISELWGFQISRLYEIYIEEQINLQVLTHENETEKAEIVNQRDTRQQRWPIVLAKLESERNTNTYNEQKDAQIDDLMGQL